MDQNHRFELNSTINNHDKGDTKAIQTPASSSVNAGSNLEANVIGDCRIFSPSLDRSPASSSATQDIKSAPHSYIRSDSSTFSPSLTGSSSVPSHRYTTSPTLDSGKPSASSVALAGMDRFASVYIPAWLLAVNDSSPSQFLAPSSPRKQDLQAYAENIYPKALLDRIVKSEVIAKAEIEKVLARLSSDMPKLDDISKESHAYAKRLLILQFKEHAQRWADLAKAALFAVSLEPYTEAGLPHLYKLSAPAIREGWPPLESNDAVHLRQLRPNQRTWQRVEFVATVYSTKRVQGIVILKCEALHDYIEHMIFNVTFRPQGTSSVSILSTFN